MSEDFMLDRANLASNVSGVLVIDKPTGMTSHDVVQVVRNGTHIRRAGHTGTLDPRASGCAGGLGWASGALGRLSLPLRSVIKQYCV